MIVKDKTDEKIEQRKARLGLEGDVYIYNHRIEDMAGHRRLIPESEAQTIEEAYDERVEYERQLEEEREAAAQAAAQAAAEEAESAQGDSEPEEEGE